MTHVVLYVPNSSLCHSLSVLQHLSLILLLYQTMMHSQTTTSHSTMLRRILSPAGAGALFGAALTASGVYLPTVIIKQMQLRDFHMLQVFLTACAASA
jgi:hypothetical protein